MGIKKEEREAENSSTRKKEPNGNLEKELRRIEFKEPL